MDFKKILDIISSNNIDQGAIFELVAEAKTLDLTKEENIRLIIRKGSKITNKSIDKETENKIVEMVKKEGIGPNLLKFL